MDAIYLRMYISMMVTSAPTSAMRPMAFSVSFLYSCLLSVSITAFSACFKPCDVCIQDYRCREVCYIHLHITKHIPAYIPSTVHINNMHSTSTYYVHFSPSSSCTGSCPTVAGPCIHPWWYARMENISHIHTFTFTAVTYTYIHTYIMQLHAAAS